MTEFSDILRTQIERYPGMQPQDAVKLAFQSEFGGGHLIADEAACLRYLYEECAATPVDGGAPLYEEIGGGMARVHLAALAAAGVAPETLGRAFLVSARTPQGTREGLERKLSLLEEAAGAGRFVFSAEALRDYLRDYAAAGYPAVSHSAAYRAAYHPAYRVVRLSFARALRLIAAAEAVRQDKGGVFLAIDGMAAAGKSTLAADLAAYFGEEECTIVHMDDFFLPPALRAAARYAESGGNIHYERFREEVVEAFSRPAFTYARWDCARGAFGPVCTVPRRPVCIVEGSYSMHPYFGDPYDLSVYLWVTPAEQRARILRRNGADWAQDFETKWIPMENAYASAFNIPKKCSFSIRNE